ncbi:MAG TPA: hypothetical protein DEB25_06845 [Desulfobulbaceae bacterium]|nr:hypothetical protein [Desulfobulbaceae bacterium]
MSETQAGGRATLKLLTDQAIGEGNSEEYDGLDFTKYAQVLANAALGVSPLTIGVFGEWGTGKTSLMRLVEKELEEQQEPGPVSVWFNAWRQDQREVPLVPQ